MRSSPQKLSASVLNVAKDCVPSFLIHALRRWRLFSVSHDLIPCAFLMVDFPSGKGDDFVYVGIGHLSEECSAGRKPLLGSGKGFLDGCSFMFCILK